MKEELELVALAPARLLDRAEVRPLRPPDGSWSAVLCARDAKLCHPHHLDRRCDAAVGFLEIHFARSCSPHIRFSDADPNPDKCA